MAVILAASVSACAVPQSAPPQTASTTVQNRSPAFDAKGLEAVIGQSADRLERLFGKPRLDINEGDARKLQFTNGQCILDAYIYPEGVNNAPIVTYVDARRDDGQPVDRASCVAALRR